MTLLLLAPAFLPGIAIVFGLHGIFLRLGLVGTVQGVILAHLIPVLPYMVLVMAASSSLLVMSRTKLWSIFRQSMGRRLSALNDE